MVDLTTTPAISFHRGFYDGKSPRTKRARWTGDTIDGKTLLVELSVSHDVKQFRVYLTRMLESTDRGFSVHEFQPFRDVVRFPSIPTARFSAKALDAAFTEALANVPDYAGTLEVTALCERAV